MKFSIESLLGVIKNLVTERWIWLSRKINIKNNNNININSILKNFRTLKSLMKKQNRTLFRRLVWQKLKASDEDIDERNHTRVRWNLEFEYRDKSVRQAFVGIFRPTLFWSRCKKMPSNGLPHVEASDWDLRKEIKLVMERYEVWETGCFKTKSPFLGETDQSVSKFREQNFLFFNGKLF